MPNLVTIGPTVCPSFLDFGQSRLFLACGVTSGFCRSLLVSADHFPDGLLPSCQIWWRSDQRFGRDWTNGLPQRLWFLSVEAICSLRRHFRFPEVTSGQCRSLSGCFSTFLPSLVTIGPTVWTFTLGHTYRQTHTQMLAADIIFCNSDAPQLKLYAFA